MGEGSVRVVPPSVEIRHHAIVRDSSNFGRALQFVLDREGIQSIGDDDDPGGHTVFGIARKFWPRWEGWVEVDYLNSTTSKRKERERSLSGHAFVRTAVRYFYLKEFWLANKCDKMPFEVALPLFDFAVNSVAREARKALQRAVGAKPDGVIGPKTLAALRRKSRDTNSGAMRVGMAITDARLMRYVRRVQQGKSPAKYLGGWMRRIVAVSHEMHR